MYSNTYTDDSKQSKDFIIYRNSEILEDSFKVKFNINQFSCSHVCITLNSKSDLNHTVPMVSLKSKSFKSLHHNLHEFQVCLLFSMSPFRFCRRAWTSSGSFHHCTSPLPNITNIKLPEKKIIAET